MSKRFVDLSRYRQAWRKLDSKAFRAFYYMWDQADPAGVYRIDKDQFKFDNGYPFTPLMIEQMNAGTKCIHDLGDGRLLLVDFIADNYGSLREGYNPHKPAFRALEKNGLELNTSYSQACFKLEDEEEDEDEEEKLEGVQGKPAVILDERFEALWGAYGKVGSKPEALKYWRLLDEVDKMAIEAKLPAYIQSTPGGRWRKHLQGWINPAKRLWESAIVVYDDRKPTPTERAKATVQGRNENPPLLKDFLRRQDEQPANPAEDAA